MNALDSPSTRPYLIRALHEWCSDGGLTPYIAVFVDETVQVPAEYVQDREIVLNISLDAVSSLQLGNEFIEFKARFGGIPRDIYVPIDRVMAIYARENGQGMAFPIEVTSLDEDEDGEQAEDGPPTISDIQLVPRAKPGTSDDPDPPVPPTPPAGRKQPTLKRVK